MESTKDLELAAAAAAAAAAAESVTEGKKSSKKSKPEHAKKSGQDVEYLFNESVVINEKKYTFSEIYGKKPKQLMRVFFNPKNIQIVSDNYVDNEYLVVKSKFDIFAKWINESGGIKVICSENLTLKSELSNLLVKAIKEVGNELDFDTLQFGKDANGKAGGQLNKHSLMYLFDINKDHIELSWDDEGNKVVVKKESAARSSSPTITNENLAEAKKQAVVDFIESEKSRLAKMSIIDRIKHLAEDLSLIISKNSENIQDDDKVLVHELKKGIESFIGGLKAKASESVMNQMAGKDMDSLIGSYMYDRFGPVVAKKYQRGLLGIDEKDAANIAFIFDDNENLEKILNREKAAKLKRDDYPLFSDFIAYAGDNI